MFIAVLLNNLFYPVTQANANSDVLDDNYAFCQVTTTFYSDAARTQYVGHDASNNYGISFFQNKKSEDSCFYGI